MEEKEERNSRVGERRKEGGFKFVHFFPCPEIFRMEEEEKKDGPRKEEPSTKFLPAAKPPGHGAQ